MDDQSYVSSDKDEQDLLICRINSSLITELTGYQLFDFNQIFTLSLNVSSKEMGVIRKIENLDQLISLQQLNLSYNAITKIDGLDRLTQLIELNLAENMIDKIENLDRLVALERLNLSGNRIENIPTSIANLSNLKHLRLARNKLSTLQDLTHLIPLVKLNKLRIDENPFSQYEETNSYAIFCLNNLELLNGTQVSPEDRENASMRFNANISEMSLLKQLLNDEIGKANALKKEINEPQKVSRSFDKSGIKSRKVQLEMYQANQQLTLKVQQLKEAESTIVQLQQKINIMDAIMSQREVGNNKKQINTPKNYTGDENMLSPSTTNKKSSKTDIEIIKNENNLNNNSYLQLSNKNQIFEQNHKLGQSVGSIRDMSATDSPAPFTPVRTPSSIGAYSVAVLTDRLEKLSSKLLKADKEKLALFEELENKQTELDDIIALNQSYHNKQLEMELLMNNLENDYNLLKESAKNYHNDGKHANENIQKLEINVNKMKQLNDELMDENVRIKSENNFIKNELTNIMNINKELLQKIEEIKVSNKQLYDRNNELMDENNNNKDNNKDNNNNYLQIQSIAMKQTIEESNQIIIQLQNENNKLSQKLRLLNDSFQIIQQENNEIYSQNIQLKNQLLDEINKNKSYENDNNNLSNEKLLLLNNNKKLEYDKNLLLLSYQKLESDFQTFAKTKMKINSPKSSSLNNNKSLFNNLESSYFRSPSVTDPREQVETSSIDSDNNNNSNYNNGNINNNNKNYNNNINNNNSNYNNNNYNNNIINNTKFHLSKLELIAAESLASALIEEIQLLKTDKNVIESRVRVSSKEFIFHPDALKEACVKVALRFILSASIQQSMAHNNNNNNNNNRGKEEDQYDIEVENKISYDNNNHKKSKRSKSNNNNNNNEILPLSALGDPAFLAKIVAETQVGLLDIEQSKAMKQEIKHFENLIKSLEEKAIEKEKEINESELLINKLKNHCEETKRFL
eukprot:gene5943-8192_t